MIKIHMSFFKRILCYCKEQLEPGSRLLLSILIGLFVFLLIYLEHDFISFEWHFLVPSLGTFSLLIYYRISDEFKDIKTDQRFFPDRPIPSGRLFLNDLRMMLLTTAVFGFALNVIYSSALKEFLAAFIFTILMGKWFFMEKIISKNRLLAFATHGPVGIFLYWYLEAYLLNMYALSWSLEQKLSLVAFIILPGFSWEVLRKSYLPQDEIEGYQIYSTMLGFRGALSFASFWVILTIINNYILIKSFSSLRGMEIPLLIVNVLLLVAIFIQGMKPWIKNLKPISEFYMGFHLLLPLGFLIFKVWNK